MLSLYTFISNNINKYSTHKLLFLLQENNFDEDEVKLTLFKKFNIPFNKMNITFAEIRTKQNEYRKALINRFQKCVISGLLPEECEAAHIVPYKDELEYDIDNGLLLSANLHKLFDKYIWSIHPETQKIVINWNSDKELSIWDYKGKYISNLSENNLKYIKKHHKEFIKKYNNI